jgi:hypothetical protein
VVEFEKRNRDVLARARVLHDHGGAFKKDREFILAERSDRVVALPPEQHGELSGLDNKLNAVAKHMWRKTVTTPILRGTHFYCSSNCTELDRTP